MWVPLKKIKNKSQNAWNDGQKAFERFFLFFLFCLLLVISQIHEILIVGINTKSALRDEGYAWVPETRDFTENSGKY